MSRRKDLWYKSVLLVLSLALIAPMLSACGGGSSASSVSTITSIATAETEIYNNGNLGGVINNPSGGPTTFTITGNYKVTLITDYHWNNGQGTSGGTIGLKDSSGKVVGTWPVTVRNGVYWDVKPNIIIGPGTYTLADSDSSTWAQNSGSNYQGITDVKGLAVTYIVSANTTTSSTKNTTQSAGAKNTQPAMDVTADKASATIGQNGGEVDLKNGTKLVVPAGALNSNASLQVNQLSNPVDFGKDTTAYDISGLNQATNPVTLTFPVTQGLTSDEVSVCAYNTTSQQASVVPYTYDAADNTVTVTIDPNTISSASYKPRTSLPILASVLEPLFKLFKPNYSISERLRILFTPETTYTAESGQYVIPTPFYEQSGGSCWATDTLMLIRTYDTGDIIQRNLGEPLYACNEAGVSLADFGLDAYGFETALASYISGQTSATVEWRGYYNMDNLRSEILRQLDNSHPMIIHLPGIGHYALIIGYRDSGNTLIIQDSNGVALSADQPNLGGMYFVRTFDWIRSMEGGINNLGGVNGSVVPVPLQILWVDKAATFPGTLQTIDCPGAGESYSCSYGTLDFYKINPKVTVNNKVPLGYLQFDPSQLTGYSWFGAQKTAINTISNTATNLELKMPVFNSARVGATVTEKTLIRSNTTQLDVETQDVTLPAAQDNITVRVNVNQDIALDKIVNPALADANGIEPLSIDVTLNQDGKVVDHFEVDANLSIIPNITSFTPGAITPGNTLGIYGDNFGDKQLTKSRVTVNGVNAQITGWMPDEIEIKLPAGSASGQPVIVYTGDRYEYKSNAMNLTAPVTYKITCSIDPAMNEAFAECGGDLYVTSPLLAGQQGEIMIGRSESEQYRDANGKAWVITFNGFTGGSADIAFTDVNPGFSASEINICAETFIMPAHDVSLVAHFTLSPP